MGKSTPWGFLLGRPSEGGKPGRWGSELIRPPNETKIIRKGVGL